MIMTEEEMDEQLELMEELDDYDYCYECRGYGDDYYINADGELVDRCSECSMNPMNYDDDGYRRDNID